MNRTFALAATLAAGVAMAPLAADAAFFLGHEADGKVYKINATTGAATEFKRPDNTFYPDVGVTGSTDSFSPNALAFDGKNTYLPNCCVGNPVFQRNGTTISRNLPTGGTSGVAAAGIYNGNYIYLTQGGRGYSLVDAANAPSASGATFLGNISADTFGDFVIGSNGQRYVSYKNVGLATLSGTSLSTVDKQGSLRFAGLGFATDGSLYGVTGGGTTTSSQVWKLDPTGAEKAVKISAVMFGSSNLQLTDPASMAVSVPAALPLFLTALAAHGLIGRRRMQADA